MGTWHLVLFCLRSLTVCLPATKYARWVLAIHHCRCIPHCITFIMMLVRAYSIWCPVHCMNRYCRLLIINLYPITALPLISHRRNLWVWLQFALAHAHPASIASSGVEIATVFCAEGERVSHKSLCALTPTISFVVQVSSLSGYMECGREDSAWSQSSVSL